MRSISEIETENILILLQGYMAAQADAATRDVQIKYDEFQKSCKTILPKIANRGFSFSSAKRFLTLYRDTVLKLLAERD